MKLTIGPDDISPLFSVSSAVSQKGWLDVVLTVNTESLVRRLYPLHQPITGEEVEVMLVQVSGMSEELEQTLLTWQGERREDMKRS